MSSRLQARLSTGSALPGPLRGSALGSRAIGRAREGEKKQTLNVFHSAFKKINKAARQSVPRFSTSYCEWEECPTAGAGAVARSPSVVQVRASPWLVPGEGCLQTAGIKASAILTWER